MTKNQEVTGKELPKFTEDSLLYKYRWPRRLLVYGSLASMGLLGWNYYTALEAISSFEEPGFSFSDPSGLSMGIKDLEKNPSFLKTDGKFTWVLKNDCEVETLILAEVTYSVSHLPWTNNSLSMVLRPNEKLVELSDGSTREIKVDGRITKAGALLEYSLPKTEFLNFDNAPKFTLANGAEGFIRTTWSSGRLEVESRGDLLVFHDSQDLELRKFGAYVDLNPGSNSTVVVGGEKLKAQSLFLDSPRMQLRTSSYGFSGQRLDYSAKSNGFSALGVYSRLLETSGAVTVEDWANFKEVASQVYSTCAGQRADEESRLRTRLALNEVIKKGMSFEVSDFHLDGENGTVRAKLEADLQSDDIGRAADLHQALSVKGKVQLAPGIFDLNALEETRKVGGLFLNSQGQYLASFAYAGKELKLNNLENAGAANSGLFNFLRTGNMDLAINSVYTNLTMGISPFAPLNSLYNHVPMPVGEVQEVKVSENLLKNNPDEGIIQRSRDLVDKDGISFSVRIPK